jgi:methionine-rich copper-binding protein CopC
VSDSNRRDPVLALAAAIVGLLVLGVVPAFAHAELVSSDPADGARLPTSPTTITLTFSEGVNAKKSSFDLKQGGTVLGTGKAAADGDATMTLDGVSLDPGDYAIQWTSVAEDGDLLRGTIGFTVLQPASTAGASPTAATSPTPTPLCTDECGGSATPVAPTPSPQASSATAPPSSSGSDVLLPIVIGLLVLAAAGAFLFSRTRRA